ncbi:MAG: DUF4249 domain-containing protein [Bacteroidota bacterium]
MKRYSFFSLILFALSLASCQDVIDLKVDEGKPLLVVDGYVTDQPGPYAINLSKTAGYFSNAPTPRVRGAILTISDNEGHTETLVETDPGKYVTSTLQGKIGNHYILTVKAEGEEYRAEATIKRVPQIDSLKQMYREKSEIYDEGYYVQYFGPELAGKGDFYQFKIYKNDVLENKPGDLTVSSDDFVEGNYISGPEMNNDPFKAGDKIQIQTCSITEDNYKFLNELYLQVNNAGMFANPPANVRTNLVNVNVNSTKKAVGYFGGMAIRSKEIVIQDQK